MTRMRWVIAGLSLTFAPVSVAGAAAPGPDPNPGSTARLVVAAERSGLRPEVLRLALEAYASATARHLTSRPVLTVIDYSLSSREKRLWVLDVRREAVLAHELVAHGRNTGDDLAERFSNRPGSLQSSLGAFLTGGTYSGKRAGGQDQGQQHVVVPPQPARVGQYVCQPTQQPQVKYHLHGWPRRVQ